MSSRRLLAWYSGSIMLLQAAPALADTLRDPTNPNAPVSYSHYHSVMSGYQLEPVRGKPGNWRELNDRMERIGGPLGQLRDPSEPIQEKKK